MLSIKNLHVSLAGSGNKILYGMSVDIAPGTVSVIKGRNGSGKSTLAAALSGSPQFKVTSGKATLDGADLLTMSPHERSLAGLFLAHQYPLEIPGVNLSHFLRLAYNAHKQTELPVFKFRKLLKERAALINYPEKLLDRNLNEGFSGGEKKKTEILQLALLEPKYAFLDETDSGLDQEAIDEVFSGLASIRRELLPQLALVVITHYDRVLDYLQPDHTYHMQGGKLSS